MTVESLLLSDTVPFPILHISIALQERLDEVRIGTDFILQLETDESFLTTSLNFCTYLFRECGSLNPYLLRSGLELVEERHDDAV
jgi:hypothetical protein